MLLAVFFSLQAIAPAVSAAVAASGPPELASEANLPPCCRKDGKHACGMVAKRAAKLAAASSGPSLAPQAAVCSQYPQPATAASPASSALAVPQSRASAAIAHPDAAQTHAVESRNIHRQSTAFARAIPKRGPPHAARY